MSPSKNIPTSQFEAVKVSMKQDATGHIITLRIHPDEMPEEILRDFVGARYQIVAVRLNDDDSPMPRLVTNKAVAIAGKLCRQPRFWDWLENIGEINQRSEEAAVTALCRILGIKSRKEIADVEGIAEALLKLEREFHGWDASNDEVPF